MPNQSHLLEGLRRLEQNAAGVGESQGGGWWEWGKELLSGGGGTLSDTCRGDVEALFENGSDPLNRLSEGVRARVQRRLSRELELKNVKESYGIDMK
ncbi:hypothetical protein HZA38_01125 [Candidatus Peregrinibacteria bacterium]|nr:hypothetical protein [Candidatus Peregrinibacteria bacterium]